MTTFAIPVDPFLFARLLMPKRDGAGTDVVSVEQRVRQLREEYQDSPAITDRQALLAESFHALAAEWRQATSIDSSLMHAVQHPAYRAIVQLGEDVVPVLLQALRRHPESWFLALREITGIDPVKPEHRGNMRAIADAWLDWGRLHGLL